MTESAKIFFQKLDSQLLEKQVAKTLEEQINQGTNCLLRLPNQSCLEHLDTLLWTYNPTSFTAHGTAEQEYPEKQPIYLSCTAENPNQAKFLLLFGDTQAQAQEFQQMDAIHLLFDINHAESRREYWRALVQQGYEPISL